MYNILRFDIAAVIVTIAVSFCFFSRKNISTKTARVFATVVLFVGFASIFDTIYNFMIIKGFTETLWTLYLIKILYQLAFHTIPISFCVCMNYVTLEDKSISKKYLRLMPIPWIVCILLILTTVFTKWILYFDENHIYHHGKLSFYLYLEALFYISQGLAAFYKKGAHFNFHQQFTIYFFTFSCAISLIVQSIFPTIRFTNFAVSISILLVYLSLQNPGDYIDKEMGIYNKAALISNLGFFLEKNKKIYFLALRISNIEFVYELLGSESRAALMKSLSDFLQSIFDKKNIYRVTNSRVAIILSNDEKIRKKQLEQVVQGIKEPFKCGTTQIVVTFLAKLVYCPEDAQSIEDVIALLEHSFLSTENGIIARANPKLLELRRRETLITHALEKAIETNDFIINFQPIFSTDKHRFTKAEVIVQIESPDLGIVNQNEFMPIAEQNGLMLNFGSLMFKKICQILKRTRLWNYGIETVSVKLSTIQCLQESLSDQILEIMDFYKIRYSFINLEISESSLENASVELKKTMKILYEKGFSFTLDSYGTGSSNLATIVQYPFAFARFDCNMILDAMKDEKAQIILNETNAMLKDLNMKTFAVGIEEQELAKKLIQMECDYLQGNFYSQPLNEEDYIKFIYKK
ncbi:MAG: EAL domain-containing protein [Treponema sp.]|nr:EAL domain-containing protein [Treponema sp.]